MCLPNADLMAQKFGFQISEHQTGLSNVQKSLNQFDKAVYYPTNWHNTQYETWRAKYPDFIRYGGFVPVSPEYFQKNYLGVFGLKNQPIIEEAEAFTKPRFS